SRSVAPRRAAACAGADGSGDGIGIKTKQAVVSERADIGNTQHRVRREMLLHREVPLLNGWSLRIRLYALRREYGIANERHVGTTSAGRRGLHTGGDRNDRRKRAGK